MAKDAERLVATTPVRDVDSRVVPVALSLPTPQRTACITELRQLVLGGYYASERMMDLVARRLQAGSDL